MTEQPPFQNDEFGFNTDALSALINVYERLNRKFGDSSDDSNIKSNQLHRLTDMECEYYFRSNGLMRKIVTKYPNEAKSIGYEIHDQKGNVLETGDDILLEAFKEASIYARLYSRCDLKLIFSGNQNEELPIKRGSKLEAFEILFDIHREGDYYVTTDGKIHHERILVFYGAKSYAKRVTPNDINYADSILQGIVDAFEGFLNNNENANYILRNLSYITVGLEGLGLKLNSKQGEDNVYNRMTAFNMNRSIFKTLTYDAEKEKIDFIKQTLSGVHEMIEVAKNILVSNADYPIDQIFEQIPTAKLGSSGIQNQLVARYLWAKRCHTWVIDNWMPNLKLYFDRVFDMSGRTIEIPFIVELTEAEKAVIEKDGAERISKLISAGIISVNEARTGYKGDIYTLNIELEENPELGIQVSENVKGDVELVNDSIPDDDFWDELSRITSQDLINIGEGIIK